MRHLRRSPPAWALLVGTAAASTVVLSLVLLASPAIAKEGDSGLDPEDQIVLNGRLLVPEGETAGTALIFNGPATIEGTVRENLVVFNGDVDISGTVLGDVVVFNGDVVVRSSAEVDGDLVTQKTPTIEDGATVRGRQERVATHFDFANLGLASKIVWWLGYSISTLILGLLLLVFAPRLDLALLEATRARTGASLGVGVGAFFLLPIVAVLFLAIVVAIPLGLFTLLALGLLYTIGYVAGSIAIGRRLAAPPSSRFVAFLAGWGVLRLLALVPVVAGIVWFFAAIFGLGAMIVAARRTAPARAAVPPPPPPMATT